MWKCFPIIQTCLTLVCLSVILFSKTWCSMKTAINSSHNSYSPHTAFPQDNCHTSGHLRSALCALFLWSIGHASGRFLSSVCTSPLDAGLKFQILNVARKPLLSLQSLLPPISPQHPLISRPTWVLSAWGMPSCSLPSHTPSTVRKYYPFFMT